MPQFVSQAQPPLDFIPQRISPWVIKIVRALLPLWMPWKLSIASVQAENLETLIKLYQDFQAGDARFLMAFRHPSTKDPFSMSYLLWTLLPRAARQADRRFQRPTYSHFIYDRGIPLWAGAIVSWLFPRLGGTPIFRGKADRLGLRAARDLFANSPYPIAVAPEGGTNEHNEIVSPLEPGVSQLGFWCAEDLKKAKRTESVYILPIGIRYRYVSPPWTALNNLIAELETDVGLAANPEPPPGLLADPQSDLLYGRVLRVAGKLLTDMEHFYSRYYHLPLADETEANLEREAPAAAQSHWPAQNLQLAARLRVQLNNALQVVEQYFGIRPRGELVDRCRRLEQAGFDRIYRQDLGQLTPLERGMADWLAQEASLRIGHMRLVERLTMVSGNYILTQPTADRFAEIVIILWKVITYMRGGDQHQPPSLGKQSVQVTIGEPISISDRWPTYQTSRRHAKKAIDEVTQILETALNQMVV